MKRKFKIAGLFVSVVILAILVAGIITLVMPGKKTATGVSASAIAIDYNNLAPVLSSTSLIRDLPKNSVILLKFYNFNSGARQWEKSYVIKQGKVYEGNENADITLTLHSKYLSGLTTGNFCSMIQQAKKNGDLGIETSISSVSLAWKFKSMYKYKDCLGL